MTVTGEDGNCSYTETIEVEGFASEAPLSVEAEVVNTCPQYPSGRIELHITGGVPYPNVIGFPHIPYMVRWQGNHSSHFELAYNLGAGDYPVTVTDFCGNTVTGFAELGR